MENSEKKPLISIRNLKQYFPLKKKGEFVKANDGISIDIYPGETFGLVGESGCGKSTLGRTILQFYKQTEGRTIYYGRSIEEEAPKYVEKTIRNYGKLSLRLKELREKAEEEQKKYDSLDEKTKMVEADKLVETKRNAEKAFLDLAGVFGGFMTVDDIEPVRALLLEKYRFCLRLKQESEKLADAKLILADTEYRYKDKKDSADAKAKISQAQSKVSDVEKASDDLRKQIAEKDAKLQALRDKYKGNKKFEECEKYREDGIDLARLEYNEMRLLRCDLQMIFQDPYSSLNPRMTVGQIIGEGMIAHHMFRKEDARMQEQVLKVMNDCGLAPYFIHRYPFEFSGGQRQRVGIARSLAVNPRFVVCDEAVSALDVSIQSQVINLLKDLKDQQSLTYMFITHDLSVVKYISDRIGVMYLGVMVELASSDDIFAHQYHPYTKALLEAIPTITEEGNHKKLQVLEGDIPSPVHPPKGCKFHTRCKYCTEICEHVTPQWEEAAPGHFVACHHKLM